MWEPPNIADDPEDDPEKGEADCADGEAGDCSFDGLDI
jgi:hypothetical protein